MNLLGPFSRLFGELASGGRPDADSLQKALERAAAVLLYEMSRADYHIDEREIERIVESVRETFELSQQAAEELVADAAEKSENAISLYQYISLINDHWGPDTKESLMVELWKVAYVDGVLDKYEEYQARRLAELLHLPHSRFIRAKLQARDALGMAAS